MCRVMILVTGTRRAAGLMNARRDVWLNRGPRSMSCRAALVYRLLPCLARCLVVRPRLMSVAVELSAMDRHARFSFRRLRLALPNARRVLRSMTI